LRAHSSSRSSARIAFFILSHPFQEILHAHAPKLSTVPRPDALANCPRPHDVRGRAGCGSSRSSINLQHTNRHDKRHDYAGDRPVVADDPCTNACDAAEHADLLAANPRASLDRLRIRHGANAPGRMIPHPEPVGLSTRRQVESNHLVVTRSAVECCLF
jgi:hypothetical protein